MRDERCGCEYRNSPTACAAFLLRGLARQHVVLLLGILMAAPLMAGEPIAFDTELTAGYDSNPAQSHDGVGLLFAQYAFDAIRPIHLSWTDLTLGLNGWYRDYEADNDNYRLNLQADWTHDMEEGAGLLTLSVSGAIYRDALVTADARNEAAVTFRYDRTLTARDSLTLAGEVRRLNYIYPSLPWAGRPGSGPAVPVSARAGRESGGVAVRRRDWLTGAGLDTTHHWSPTLSTTLSLAYVRCDSQVPVDSYHRAGLGFQMRIELAAAWRLEMGLGWSRTPYDRAPRQQERVDTALDAGFAVWRTLGPGEVFCGLDWLDSDSTIAERSFRQQVTQCGLAWSF